MDSSGVANFKVTLVDYYGNPSEVRRFTVPCDAVTNFSYLHKKLKLMFTSLADQDFVVYWIDEERDKVIITNDEELSIAVASSGGYVMKLFIRLSNGSVKGENSDVVHEGVVCDECDGQLIGFRYKCLECRDYDLCEDCEKKRLHSHHLMIRITHCLSSKLCDRFWKRMNSHVSHMDKAMQCEKRSSLKAQNGDEHCDRKKKSRHNKYKCDHDSSGEENHCHRGQSEKKHRKSGNSCSKSFMNLLDRCELFVNPSAAGNEGASASISGHELAQSAFTEAVIGNISALLQPLLSVVQYGRECQSKEAGNSSKTEQNPTKASDAPSDKMQVDSEGRSEKDVEKMSSDFANQSISSESSSASHQPQESGVAVNQKENSESPSVEIKHSAPELGSSGAERFVDNSQASRPQTGGRLYPSVPSDPKVASSLMHMMSMGFTNEDGWLARLLEEKNGDIYQVLEYLQSVKK